MDTGNGEALITDVRLHAAKGLNAARMPFVDIALLSDSLAAAGQCAREVAGRIRRIGREWQPGGQPVAVNGHDFPAGVPKAIPYGVYDIGANSGFVSVGVDHDTAPFAVNALRTWWQRVQPPVSRGAPVAGHRRRGRLQRQGGSPGRHAPGGRNRMTAPLDLTRRFGEDSLVRDYSRDRAQPGES